MARTLKTPDSLLPAWKEPASFESNAAVAEPPAETQSQLPLDATSAADQTASYETPFDGKTFVTSASFGPAVIENDGNLTKQPKTAELLGTAESVDGNEVTVSILPPLTGWPEERKLLDPIYACQREILQLLDAEIDLKRQLEEVQDNLRSFNDSKALLLKELPGKLIELRDGVKLAQTAAAIESQSEPELEPLAWRSKPTGDLLKGIPRLGDKKAELIVEQFPTLGDLNDARARAATTHVHFATLLPKNVGKQIAEEITNRLMQAELPGNDKPCSESVEPRKTDADRRKQWIRAMEATYRATMTKDAIKDDDSNESWSEGFEACKEGQPVYDCPNELTEAYQQEWIQGWVAYDMFVKTKALSATETASEESAADEPPLAVNISTEVETINEESVEPEPEPVNAMAEFDIDAIAAQLKAENNFDIPRVSRDAWAKGCEDSMANAQPLEACPEYPNLEYRKDWIRGWLSGQDEGL